MGSTADSGTDAQPTDSNASARDLQREVAHLRRALADSSLVAARVDRDLRYTWIYNPHLDFDPTGVIGRRDDELADNDGIRVLMDLKQRVLDHGEVVRRNIAFPVSDGYRTYDVRGEPLRNAEGEVVGLTTVSLDVTDRIAAEQALHYANQELEARVRKRTEQVRSLAQSLSNAEQHGRSMIAKSLHDDIQQTLHAMQLHLGLAISDEGERRERELSQVKDLLGHSIQVVRELTKEIDPPLLRPGNLAEALTWLVEHVRERYALSLDLDLGFEDTFTVGDRHRRMILRSLREVVVNLVTHEGVMEVHLTATRQGKNLVFELQDGHVDIPPEDLFSQPEDQSRLETIRERVLLHDGSLELDSTGEGKTLVRLAVPLQESDQDEA
jgi:signal transduction histidine kinase